MAELNDYLYETETYPGSILMFECVQAALTKQWWLNEGKWEFKYLELTIYKHDKSCVESHSW